MQAEQAQAQEQAQMQQMTDTGQQMAVAATGKGMPQVSPEVIEQTVNQIQQQQ